MSEIILALLLIAFFVYHVYFVKTINEQVGHLVKLLKAKDLPEYNTTIRAESDVNKQKVFKRVSIPLNERPIIEDELVPMSEALADDRIFNKMIKNAQVQEALEETE